MSNKDLGRALPTATSNAHKAAGNWAGRVSAALRKGGLNPIGNSDPTSRQALRVKSSEVGRCTVVADFDTLSLAEHLIEAAAVILRGAGYRAERDDVDANPIILRLVVTRGAGVPEGWKRRKDALNVINYEHRAFPGWAAVVDGNKYRVRKMREQNLPEPFDTLGEAIDWIESNGRKY